MKLGLGSLEPRAKAVFLQRMLRCSVRCELSCVVRRINETRCKPARRRERHRKLNYTDCPIVRLSDCIGRLFDCSIDTQGLRRLKEGQRIVKYGCRHRPRIIIVLSPTP